jgi:predicted nucleotidyltransferase
MISQQAKKLIRKLAVKYNLKLVMLFGSAIKKTFQDRSDLDIAILADKDFYEKHYSDFLYDLVKVENLEKREIEVVPISDINPILLYNIFNQGIPLYKKNEEEYWRILNWARITYEENKRFFYGREKLMEKRLAKIK